MKKTSASMLLLASLSVTACQSSSIKEPEPGTVLLACITLGVACNTLGNSGAGAPVAKTVSLSDLPGWKQEFKFRKQFYTCIDDKLCPKGSFVTHSINIVDLEGAKEIQRVTDDPDVEGKKLTKKLTDKVSNRRTTLIPKSQVSTVVLDNRKGIQQTFFTEGKIDKRVPRGSHFISVIHENENHIIFGHAHDEKDAKKIATQISTKVKF